MKYIIELECEPMIANSFHQEVDKLWKAKGFNSLVFDQYGIKKLTPYTEPDRKAIEDEVWSLAREIAYCMSFGACKDAGTLCDDDIYTSATGVLEKLSYQEAKAKYEAWKKGKEKLRVGDEVIYHRNKYIVGYVGEDEVYHLVDQCWIRVVVQGDHQLTKTGRHFPEVMELLKKTRDTE